MKSVIKVIGIILKKENLKFVDEVESKEFIINDKNLKETLIIDATYTEPFYHVNEFLITKYTKDIIKNINTLIKNKKIKECHLAITGNNHNLEEKIITLTDKYKNIKILKTPNIYPIAYEKNLIRYLKHTDKCENIKVIELKDFYKPIETKIITVYYDKIYDIEVPYNIKIKDILKNLKIKENVLVFENGPLRGYLSDKDKVLGSSTSCIYLEKEHKKNEEKCIRCGKCMNNCPLKLNPTIIDKNLKEKCIKCGICTYICPSFIPLKQKIEEFQND